MGNTTVTHKDVLRLSHARINSDVANFVLGKEVSADTPVLIPAFQGMQNSKSVDDVLKTLEDNKNLPWQTIPTEFLKDVRIWKTLFYNGQLSGQGLVRNIVRIARLGGFKDLQFAADYAKALTDVEMIRKTRLHPVNLLNAAVVYAEGQQDRSNGFYSYGRNKNWETESVIKDAIDEAFHLSFKTVEPANKRTMLAIDVSGSMSRPAMGLDLSCAQVSGAVAMTVARTEPAHIIRGFTSETGGWYRGDSNLTDLGISAKTSLSVAMNKVQQNNFGGTDCALPMTWALKGKVEIDTFVVITDNETWAGNIKPHVALQKYRDKMGIPARLAVLGVAGTPFTIADPSDAGMMDFVGFDSGAPRALADFSAGRI